MHPDIATIPLKLMSKTIKTRMNMIRTRSKLCAYPNGAVPRFVGLKSDTAVRVSQNSFSCSEDGAKTLICEMSYGKPSRHTRPPLH